MQIGRSTDCNGKIAVTTLAKLQSETLYGMYLEILEAHFEICVVMFRTKCGADCLSGASIDFEVSATHLGLAFSPLAYSVVPQRLAGE